MHNRLTNVQRLSFVTLVVLIIQLSLSVSPLLSQDVTIGTQTWTSKNLDVSTFRNGEPIPEAKSREEWQKARENKTAAFCYYDYDSKNGKVYGKLYNWYAVNDSRGLAPKGYHIPSDAEWTILTDKLGGEEIAGEKMKSKTGWKGISNGGKKACIDCSDWTQSYRDKVACHTCKDARTVKIPEVIKTGGDNSSGFNGLPGGFCLSNGLFYDITEDGFWWSSSNSSTYYAWYRGLGYYMTKKDRNDDNLQGKYNGLSVRCLRD
jgi:uncharacterized protein (TIGR02145 family)